MKAVLNCHFIRSLSLTVNYVHEAWHRGLQVFSFPWTHVSIKTMRRHTRTDNPHTKWHPIDTHLAVRMTAQRRIYKDCGKKRWGPQSQKSRAACPATQGQANHTAAPGEEGEAVVGAGQAEPLSGYSPSRHTEREEEYRQTVRGTK